MRFPALVMIAGTVAIATPAVAQNADQPTTNEVAPADNMAATNEVTVDTNMTAAPAATEPVAPAETAPAPAPAKRSIPWGLVGLLGLIGLFGKRSRTG